MKIYARMRDAEPMVIISTAHSDQYLTMLEAYKLEAMLNSAILTAETMVRDAKPTSIMCRDKEIKTEAPEWSADGHSL